MAAIKERSKMMPIYGNEMNGKASNKKLNKIWGIRLVDFKRAMNETLFPWSKCLVCGGSLDNDTYVCQDCLEKLATYERCVGCGSFLSFGQKRNHTLACPFCLHKRSKYVDEYFSALPYDGYTRKLILAFKYSDKRNYAKPMAEILTAYLLEKLPNQKHLTKFDKIAKADYVIEVPLHNERFKERGYNQATLLAEIVAEGINVPYLSDVLVRHKKTKVQNRLSPNERKTNMANAFSEGMNGQKIKGKSVIIIDDILTSGNTLNSCAKVLKKLGAKEVLAVTVTSTLVKM